GNNRSEIRGSPWHTTLVEGNDTINLNSIAKKQKQLKCSNYPTDDLFEWSVWLPFTP
nr:hypothetical protein [Tanacetum cinerariifolium]